MGEKGTDPLPFENWIFRNGDGQQISDDDYVYTGLHSTTAQWYLDVTRRYTSIRNTKLVVFVLIKKTWTNTIHKHWTCNGKLKKHN
jgi:hypothetical protein